MPQSTELSNTSPAQAFPTRPANVSTPQPLARESNARPEQQLPARESNFSKKDSCDKPDAVEIEKLEDFIATPKTPSEGERFLLDPAGDLTYDITTVDVVTVPCPGGDRLRTWNREGLLGRYFGAPSMRDAEVGGGGERISTSWVRQGLRREANKARILLYAHPPLAEGMTLNRLAEDFLQAIHKLRVREGQPHRPLLVLGHSIGGLVAKMAMVRASRDAKYRDILDECYGIAFFGTPHQGSSYLAMHSLAGSVQRLLQLSAPLPETLTADLRVGSSLLSHIDEDFKEIASDLRIWTFYETIDSRLFGRGAGTGVARTTTTHGNAADGDKVYFTAPLTSIKSAILGMRQERIFPLQSDHANVASFGRHNVQTLRLFLRQIAEQVEHADANIASSVDEQGTAAAHWSMPDLEQKVNVEIHGFFDDLVAGAGVTAGRAWSTRLPLREFISKGPDECLIERLNEVDGSPSQGQFLKARGRTSLAQVDGSVEHSPSPSRAIISVAPAMTVKDALGIDSKIIEPIEVVAPMSPIIQPLNSLPRTGPPTWSPKSAPVGPIASPPFCVPSPPSRYAASVVPHASPLLRAAQFEQDLFIDRLSPPLRGRRATGGILSLSRSASLGSDGAASRIRYRDFPPFSVRSHSTGGGDDDMMSVEEEGGLEASPPLPENIFGVRSVFGGDRRMEAAVLLKPEAHAKKFTWIHLAYNNPAWVKTILQTLQVCSGKNLSHLYGPDFWATKHTRGRHSQHYAYFAKPGCYFTAPRPLSPMSTSAISPTMAPFAAEEGMYTCLFLPYLHFDTYKRLLRRRNLILQRLIQGRSRPVPANVAKADSTEMQVIWEFLGGDPPVNCRRTLDQFGYPSLRDTRSRDDDQMLYKLTKERFGSHGYRQQLHAQGSSTRDGSNRSGNEGGNVGWKERLTRFRGQNEDQVGEEEVLNGNVLMVDQLWLWVINTQTVVTCFPKREGDPIEGPLFQQADLRDSIFNEVNVDLTRQCENALDLAALSVLHAVTVLLDRSSHPDLEVFRIFEEAISVLTEKLTSSLKDFRTEGVRDKTFDFEPVENRLRSIRARHKEEGRRAERENRDNTSALLELRDIEDELVTLLHLFERQSRVISSMHAIYTRSELRDHTVNGRVFLNEALKKVTEYIQQAEEMIRRVRGTRDDYDKLLQMVQRQAQVDEVRLSRLHADVAGAQNRSVMIFTVFTVIFLPLTFFTGLFGMNTREWGGGDNLSLQTIGKIALPSSVFLIVASLIIAWSTTVRKLFRYFLRGVRRVQEYVYVFVWDPCKRALRELVGYVSWRKEVDDEGGEAVVDGSGRASGGPGALRQEASDFWDRHRLERDKAYRIPEVNRRGVRKGWSVRTKKDNKAR
ncbi:ankyrin repeat protein [Cordyceps fumosorosea ARSEF 2679]|uniref:Ankyrin repeat protein n=1 Tax=Cordyceps fumosorosea (strain ARSEF 2679) TaxID=1081104 RepID=A0A168EU05_CORFA|nr:ankyrin repeat protein [Cordyceps fumosorosea ARSEF 2679]OAA74223.1 ankyrin repeat protein [Cordyceps fumosorosea ARSEF 2679]